MPQGTLTRTTTSFEERRAAWHREVASRKSTEDLSTRALRGGRQVAPHYFAAIGHSVIDDEARDTAFSVATEAAMEAVDGFDPARGTIEQRAAHLAKRALAKAADATLGQFALPRKRAAQVRVLRSTENRLYNELGRFPTDEEIIAAAKNFSPVILRHVREADRLLRTIELDAPANEDGDTRGAYLAALTPTPTIEQRETDIAAQEAGRTLVEMTEQLLDPTTRGGRIFRGVNGLGCDKASQDELAAELSISRQRVGQLLKTVTDKLRSLPGIDDIRQTMVDARD